jgi:hypothetical protein
MHASNATFPASEISTKEAVTFALGFLIGFEREW